MKYTPHIALLLAVAAISPFAAAQAETPQVLNFVAQADFCNQLLGGDEFEGDGVTPAMSRSLSSAIDSMPGTDLVNSLKVVTFACVKKSVAQIANEPSVSASSTPLLQR